MLRIMVGLGVIGLVSLLAEPVCAQGNGQRGGGGGQGRPRQMMQANGQNNAAMANQANGQNNQMGDQDTANLAQILMTNYDADSSGSLDITELSQALVGLRELMMRNQRNMQNANAANNANANANANGAMMNQGGRGMNMARGMGPGGGGGGGRGMRPQGNGGN